MVWRYPDAGLCMYLGEIEAKSRRVEAVQCSLTKWWQTTLHVTQGVLIPGQRSRGASVGCEESVTSVQMIMKILQRPHEAVNQAISTVVGHGVCRGRPMAETSYESPSTMSSRRIG